MKNQILSIQKKMLLCFVFFTFYVTHNLSAQTPQVIVLDNFSAYNNNGTTYLSWAIKAGNTCSGIRIYRSADAISFHKIGDIGGICGSITEAINYSFTDLNPEKNKINYYRLGIGTEGYSQTIAIEIINLEHGQVIVRPNPTQANTQFFFKNDNNKLHYLYLYGIFGAGGHSPTLSTYDDYFELDAQMLAEGMYFFIIENENKNIIANGKLLVGQ